MTPDNKRFIFCFCLLIWVSLTTLIIASVAMTVLHSTELGITIYIFVSIAAIISIWIFCDQSFMVSMIKKLWKAKE
jgi:hypothetical protein